MSVSLRGSPESPAGRGSFRQVTETLDPEDVGGSFRGTLRPGIYDGEKEATVVTSILPG